MRRRRRRRRCRGEGRAAGAGGGGGGRGRHSPRTRAGSAAHGAAPEFAGPGPAGSRAPHLGFWPPPASECAPHAGQAAPPRRPAAAQERLVFASASRCRPPGAQAVASKLPGSCGCLGSFCTFIFNPISPARGYLRAHFSPSLRDFSRRARPPPKGTSPQPDLVGRGCEAKFPSSWRKPSYCPFLGAGAQSGARRSGFFCGRRPRAPRGDTLARRVGATTGPPASSRRCVQPLLAAAGRAGRWTKLVLLPGSPSLGPRVCESLGWVVLSPRLARSTRPPTLLSSGFLHPSLHCACTPVPSSPGSCSQGRFLALRPGAWGSRAHSPRLGSRGH